MRTWSVWVALGALLIAAPARGQDTPSFPAENAWIAFPCGGGPMVDARRDQPGAIQERDIVGDVRFPAGFRAVDEAFLYLRLRLDEAPNQGAVNLRPFAWGFAFSTDAFHTGYEVLVTVDGDARVVTLQRNTATMLIDSPADPADAPPAASYPFATHGRTSVADYTGTNFDGFGGDRDFFIDLAVPWTALTAVGLERDRPVVVWAASSTEPDRLDGDLACHDAMGSSGVPALSRSGSDSTSPSSTMRPPTGGAGGGGAAAVAPAAAAARGVAAVVSGVRGVTPAGPAA